MTRTLALKGGTTEDTIGYQITDGGRCRIEHELDQDVVEENDLNKSAAKDDDAEIRVDLEPTSNR